MRRYISRLYWYVGLILITLGLFGLPFPAVTAAVLSALIYYLPMSLLWIPLARIFNKYHGFPVRTFGIETERMGYIVMLIGILMTISCYFFPNATLASFGVLVIFGGVDWVLSAREEKAILDANKLSSER